MTTVWDTLLFSTELIRFSRIQITPKLQQTKVTFWKNAGPMEMGRPSVGQLPDPSSLSRSLLALLHCMHLPDYNRKSCTARKTSFLFLYMSTKRKMKIFVGFCRVCCCCCLQCSCLAKVFLEQMALMEVNLNDRQYVPIFVIIRELCPYSSSLPTCSSQNSFSLLDIERSLLAYIERNIRREWPPFLLHLLQG